MTTQTIAIVLNGSLFLGTDDPNFLEVNEKAGGILPDIIGSALCAAPMDPLELDDIVWELLDAFNINHYGDELCNKMVRYVCRCVKSCQQYIPTNGFCEFEYTYATHDKHIVLVLRYFPHEAPEDGQEHIDPVD